MTPHLALCRAKVDRQVRIVMVDTVVDCDVSSDRYYNFCIESYVEIQRSSKPAKYTELLDENYIQVSICSRFTYIVLLMALFGATARCL